MDELDRILNGKSGFKYPAVDQFDARKHVRLLRISPGERDQPLSYSLEIVFLEHLHHIHYRALSYTWGHAHSIDDIREIRIDGQEFFVRRNLFDFLNTASAKGEHWLFFIDAICINQLDHRERQFQVQEMARIFRNANEVIAWLGLPGSAQLDNVRALHAFPIKVKNCTAWTASQWAGFRYLSYHRYWSRIWVVQEVLLASRMRVWCGAFTFPLALFDNTSHMLPSPKTKVADNGRPATVVSALSRLRSPAETVVTHRLRHVLLPARDVLEQGTKVGTLEEMRRDLQSPYTVVKTFQSRTPNLLHQVMRKFGRLESSDPRDKLYGLLGMLDESSAARVEPDYTKGVSYAYYQALKIGLWELYCDRKVVAFPDQRESDGMYLGYYCDTRDAFGMADGESVSILRQVLSELRFQTILQDAVAEVQWQQQFIWRDAEISVFSDFKQLLAHAEENAEEKYPKGANPDAEGLLFKFHTRQRRMAERLGAITWQCFQRRPKIDRSHGDVG
jgi:Heterokaryon incompatibility protein (HET)